MLNCQLLFFFFFGLGLFFLPFQCLAHKFTWFYLLLFVLCVLLSLRVSDPLPFKGRWGYLLSTTHLLAQNQNNTKTMF
jgi:Na+/citrate or Na+/malate symporter